MKILTPFRVSFLAVMLAGSLHSAPVTFEDAFDKYPSEAELQNTWRMLWGGKAKVDKVWPEGSQLVLKNRVVVCELPAEISSHFDLSMRVLHTKQNRVQWFGLLNSDMTKGYVLLWDSFSGDGTPTRGRFKIYKIDASSHDLIEIVMRPEWSKELARAYAPSAVSTDQFSDAVTPPAPTLSLSWKKDNGQLLASLNGQQFMDFADTDFSQFKYIVIGGNDAGVFGDLKLTGE